MKETTATLWKFLLAIVLAVLAFVIFLNIMNPKTILEELPSPDGQFVAIKFESNAGATTKFTYRLTIVPKGAGLSFFSKGNTYISYSDFSIRWSDDRTLAVENPQRDGQVGIFKQESSVYGVEVHYSTMEK